MTASPRRIVIAYITAGIGHRRAAEALAQAARADGHDVHLVDVLDYMPAWFRWLCPRLYIFCVHFFPSVWAVSFYATDRSWVERLTGPFRRWGNRRMARRFLRWLTQLQPAVLINAHFLPPEVVAPWKKNHMPALQVWNVVTDYRPHAWWMVPGVDRYFAGLEETRDALIARGIPPQQIRVSGIPVDGQFYQPGEVEACRAKHVAAQDRLALLVTSGGYGVGPVERLCRSVLAMSPEAQARAQLIIVAGDNPALARRLARRSRDAGMPVRVLGFTREMHELMAAADVVITKPGGMTVTEALVVGRPLILFAPIWGQESGNAELLVRHGVAQLLRSPADCGPLIEQWLKDPAALAAMRARIAAMRREPATAQILSELA